MQGLGNDYIYINLLEEKQRDYSYLSKKLSDRHFGIGSDGIITIDKSDKADFKMNIYNSDGTEAEMCGNGIRCLGKYVYDNKLTKKKEIYVETKSGIKKLFLKTEYNVVKEVIVDMGIPLNHNNGLLDNNIFSKLKINNKIFEVINISMGNPHTIVFVDKLTDELVNNLGPAIQNHKFYKNKTNVEFVKIIDDNNLEVRVYERGSKETLACGTGACAAAVAYMYKKNIKSKIIVNLLGGSLIIEWVGNNHIYMKGPAKEVYIGIIDV